jgi:hypothetical protein
MRARGASLTETNGKIDEQFGIWGWDKSYPTFIAW